MWWKLAILTFVTALLIVAVIPIRTHAVKWDVYNAPRPQTWSVVGYFKAIYFTPNTLIIIAVIVLVAAVLVVRIVRAS
jgi:hypothetical protein